MKHPFSQQLEKILAFVKEHPGCLLDEICDAIPELSRKTVKNYCANLRGSGYVRWERDGKGNRAKTRNWIAEGDLPEFVQTSRAEKRKYIESIQKAEPVSDEIEDEDAESLSAKALADGESRSIAEIRAMTGLSSKMANHILARMFYRDVVKRASGGSGSYAYTLNAKAPKFIEISPGVMVAETPTGRIVKHTQNWRPDRALSSFAQVSGVQSGLNRNVSGHL
jgi:hypothetical protein